MAADVLTGINAANDADIHVIPPTKFVGDVEIVLIHLDPRAQAHRVEIVDDFVPSFIYVQPFENSDSRGLGVGWDRCDYHSEFMGRIKKKLPPETSRLLVRRSP